jgi:hypothetical protein
VKDTFRGVLRSERERDSQNERKNMKLNHLSKIAALTMTLAFTLGFAGSVQAQYKATGNDGVTASPKTRQLLDELNNNHAAAPAAIAQMGCPMCKDQVTLRTDYTARGANKPTIAVATHACKMCDTQLKTVGVGKAAKTVAVHDCDHGCSVASAN